MKQTEEQITESICQYLSFFSTAQLNRIAPSGFFKNGTMRKHKSKYIKPGVSDIQFLYMGMFYAFEVKTPTVYKYIMKHYARIYSTPKEQLSKKDQHIKNQMEYLLRVRANGFVGEFVDSIDRVKEIIDINKRNK